jgi:uncharacterized protein YndB with AHSA1/START domain
MSETPETLTNELVPVIGIHISTATCIDAPPERVFAALTTGVSVWWGAPYLENPNAKDLIFEPRLGGRFFERWSYTNDKIGALIGTIAVFEPPWKLVMQGPFGMSESAVRSVVSFTLQETSEGTKVNLSHRAIGTISEQMRNEYGKDWKELLNRLKSFVEDGKADGLRRDPSLVE